MVPRLFDSTEGHTSVLPISGSGLLPGSVEGGGKGRRQMEGTLSRQRVEGLRTSLVQAPNGDGCLHSGPETSCPGVKASYYKRNSGADLSMG